ncbi:ABC transporter permease [Microbacterium telephonicum]|uniref:Putative ABC transport system permease protein n=1 Tax=Microbacterium telephonicum TaxID=1714841 RepID=A0A498C697_9MICO|nr:ABC transporter permease [Microbacterium telephonicum]RLK48068.1 putative ABC transport system permease protein [Microbacterium telephonicum]
MSAVTSASAVDAARPTGMLRPASARRRRGLDWMRERGMGATVLVAAISTAFGVLLLSATGFLGAWLQSDPYIGGGETVAAVVGILSVLLLGVAVYVASIVTANTFATIVAGRTRRIALLRLIGASARSQRAEIARQGLVVGVVGAVLGLVLGTGAAALLVAVVEAVTSLDVAFALVQPTLLAPAVVVAVTTGLSAWVGSRRVLTVTPLQALAGSTPRTHDEVTASRGRAIAAGLLVVAGVALLGVGILVGLLSPLGVVVAFAGGLFSFTGLTLGAVHVMPPLLRFTGRAFGSSVPARLAAENALRYPERSSRMAIGVVMGVALVTMFAVANESVKGVIAASGGGELPAEMAQILDTFTGIMMGLVGVSAVIAAVGLVNLLTIGVVQRRRELGLLRALGLSSGQVRRVVLLEAVHVTVTSLAFGLVLGVAYGWAGAQSLLGSVQIPPDWSSPTFVAPGMPWLTILGVMVATALLTALAAVTPTRLATRVTPVAALAE